MAQPNFNIDLTPAGSLVTVVPDGVKLATDEIKSGGSGSNIFQNIGKAFTGVFSKGKETVQGVINSDAVQGAKEHVGKATESVMQWGKDNPQLRNAAILATTAAAVGGAIYVANKNQQPQRSEPATTRRTDWGEREQARIAARGQATPTL
jgi:hypothetical protein